MLPGTVAAMSGEREVRVRPASSRDWWWLTRQGLSPELIGRQYHWAEAPLQLYIAPARGTPARKGPKAVIEVDGRRAGYIGRNPLSGNLEYFLAPWARGGVGTRAITQFLATGRHGDRHRAFFVSHRNTRSREALLRAFGALGWVDGDDYRIDDGRLGWRITVRRDRA